MFYCDEYDKNCSDVKVEECDNGYVIVVYFVLYIQTKNK